jgi:hypothetical protein
MMMQAAADAIVNGLPDRSLTGRDRFNGGVGTSTRHGPVRLARPITCFQRRRRSSSWLVGAIRQDDDQHHQDRHEEAAAMISTYPAVCSAGVSIARPHRTVTPQSTWNPFCPRSAPPDNGHEVSARRSLLRPQHPHDRDQPFASMQRPSNSSRFASLTGACASAGTLAFDASN